MHLAIALALSATTGEPWLLNWLTYNVFWEIGAGVGAGYLIGRAFGWLTFHVPPETKLAQTGDGLIALSATFVSYGFTEIIHSYGFLSVFVTALAFRHSHRAHDFHREMHDVTEQIERLAMMVLFLLGSLLITPPLPLSQQLPGSAVVCLRPAPRGGARSDHPGRMLLERVVGCSWMTGRMLMESVVGSPWRAQGRN